MKRLDLFTKQNPVWAKVILFNVTMFLICLADGIIAFWAPVQIESSLKNTVLMGIIISFQSVVGLASDILFPSILKNASVRRLVILAILFVGMASMMLVASYFKPLVAMFMATMAIWGVYYELIAFSNNQFVATAVPPHMRSSAWGVVSIFASSAYFLGPTIAPFLILKGPFYILTAVMILLALTLLTCVTTLKNEIKKDEEFDIGNASPLAEFKHWWVLARVIWPMLVMTLCLGFIDSTFWTIGAVWSERLSKSSFLGGMFLSFYMLPAIVVGFFVAKERIYKGKKILSEKILILAGVCLMLLGISTNIYWQLGMVILASTCLSVCGPLVQGVYSDIVSRMGHEKKEMIGLTSSVVNLAYIIWPPIIGYITSQLGERLSFSYLGLLAVLVAAGLLYVTPKKLRLPQDEIRNWEKTG